MEESRVEFPGFQTYSHRDEFEFTRSMSRLQKRAPCPLQVKHPNVMMMMMISSASTSTSSSSSSSSSSLDSFFRSKDPIPLLSPLVVLESPCIIREDNTAKSH
ncbi:hypothetical protein G2W53_035756 [Senna tora]|uniref:Uncharacterized protein n=1 Tax=Senna tora TaxID=362788 RepID=A0A834W583_9FABA|nr:hypothetical protein G2W53_035756 [Senna tora]